LTTPQASASQGSPQAMPWHASAASALDGCGHCRQSTLARSPTERSEGGLPAVLGTNAGRSRAITGRSLQGPQGTGSEATSRTGRRSRLQPGQERSEWPEGKEGRSPFLRTSLHLHPQLPLGSPHSPRGTYRKRSRCGIIQGGYVATRGRRSSCDWRPPRSRFGSRGLVGSMGSCERLGHHPPDTVERA
jgi:hypothetical protein